MFVITADQIGSRRGSDLVPDVLSRLTERSSDGVLLPFVRTVGDEIQGVLSNAEAALDVILYLVRLGEWSIGLGVGPGVLGPTAPESSGEVFISARTAVERAKGRGLPVPMAIESGDGERAAKVEPLVHLLACVVAGRSSATWRVLDAFDELEAEGGERSGARVAELLMISPQAVSKHRRESLVETERAARPALAEQLEHLNS